ncbi:MAG: hypothetical protein L3J12_08215 [Spirochaetales bacterium]|nr:hypothetical protein [Spirochaetales bacterium]
MKVEIILLLLLTLVFTSCFGKDDIKSVNQNGEVLTSQLPEKTDVEIAKENEDRLPYERGLIRKERLSYGKSYGAPIIDLEEFLSMYTDEELAGIKNLSVGNNEIEKITGLERLPNLEDLILRGNNIKDITGIYLPPKLKYIVLSKNPISDISYLYDFPKLIAIGIEYTNVTSIEGIDKLENLVGLGLMGSQIENFSPLLNFTKLVHLTTRFNPGCSIDGSINPEYEEIMEKIFKNNPELAEFQYY